jgi:hypothetical protein
MMALGLLVAGLGWLALPLATGSLLVVIPVLVLGAIALEAGIVIYSVQQVSLRQAMTPIQLQGRMNSIFLVVSRGAVPIGALLGGFLGEEIGVRNTLFVAGFGVGSSAVWGRVARRLACSGAAGNAGGKRGMSQIRVAMSAKDQHADFSTAAIAEWRDLAGFIFHSSRRSCASPPQIPRLRMPSLGTRK